MRLTLSSLVGRKEQLTYIINLIFIAIGIIFIIHDYFSDYLVDGYWSAGSVREVELIIVSAIPLVLLRMNLIATAKLITSLSLILVFFVSPIFITLNYLEMYYINTLLLPVIVLTPSMVFYAKENRLLIMLLFIFSIVANFTCEQIIFRFKDVLPVDLDFYKYHFSLFSLAKIFTSLFIYVNVTHLFRKNEQFEATIVNANADLNISNQLINLQKQKIEEQNKALRESEEELKNLDVAKSHFFANISHEFRTPLTLILGPLSDQIDKSTDAKDAEKFIVMQRSATRLLNLVNQLLDLSKLESGSLNLQTSYSELRIFLRHLASQFSSIAESRKIEFKLDISQEIYLWFDADKVEKIVTNVLSNAFKFTPVGGVVSLAARINNDSDIDGLVEIEVSDSGIGIDEDKLEKIFDRFYHVSDSSRREYEGTGIGLALVKELVQIHKGTIQVTSDSGQGSIFTIRLPLNKTKFSEEEMTKSKVNYIENKTALAELEITKIKPLATQNPSDERPHILIVEDNVDLQRYLKQSLWESFRISFAMNGQEGKEIALAEQPDLIVSDLMMPKVDGMVLVKQIKTDEKTSHIPIILLTAKVDVRTKLEGIETGADDYMAKPFEIVELKARIHNLIESRRLLREKFSTVKEIKLNEIKTESLDDKFFKKVLTSIDKHLSDERFSVDTLAGDAAMSSIQLYRKLKALTGKTPNDLIRNRRLDRAKNLLEQKAGNVSEIAYQVGFRNMSYFAKCFKEKFNVNPSEFNKITIV